MVLWSNVNILMETNIFQNTLFYYFHSRHKTSFSCRVYPNSSLDYTTPLLWICYKDNRKIFAMKNKGRRIKKGFQRATAILLALIVVVLISSCSSDIPQLCNVSVQLEGSGSRELSAVIDPLSGYTIYYKSIYKGSGASYGKMAESDPYKKLDKKGILVSQGLWEIKVVFSKNTQWDGESFSTSELMATSGDIFINLNTQSIKVHLLTNNGVGFINVSSYELVAPPSNVSSISVTCYKYDETKSSFNTSGTTINVQKSGNNTFSSSTKNRLSTGIYYAVVEVKGTVSGKEIVLFTDFVGFVVRDSLTTNISGSCNTYDSTISSGGNNFIVTEDKQNDKAEIKNFVGPEFKSNGIYTITGGKYSLIPSKEPEDETYDNYSQKLNKVLDNYQDITINMNGYALNNTGTEEFYKKNTTKTLFTINKTAKLTIYNGRDVSKTISTPDTEGKETNFIVNGGTLTLGSKSEDKQIGRIALKGITYENTETNKISAIEYTSYGGTIEILAPDSDNFVTVEKTIRGISRLAGEDNDTGELNLNIEMLNSSIRAEGNNTKSEAGIYIDGTKDSKNQTYYRGLININISGKNKENTPFTIYTSNHDKVSSDDHACIVIKNYAGNITITLNDAYLKSSNGRPIYLENCTGSITINVNNCRFTSANATDLPILLKDCSTSVGNTISIPEGYYQTITTKQKFR